MRRILVFILCLSSCLLLSQNDLDSLKAILTTYITDTTRINFYEKIGNRYKRTNQDSTIYYFAKAIELADKRRLLFRKADLMTDLGYAYFRNGDSEKASMLSFGALHIFDSLKVVEQKSSAYHNLGVIFSDKGEYAKSIQYFNQALAINEAYKNDTRIAANLNPLGGVYFSLGKYDSALVCFERAYILDEKAGYPAGQAIASSNIGAIYYMNNDFTNAKKYYLKALEIELKMNSIGNLPISYSNLGEAFIAENDYDEGFKFYQKALEATYLANEDGFRPELYKMLADAHVKEGDYKKAYEYQVLFKDSKDTILKKTYTKEVTEMEVKYEAAQKDQEIISQKNALFRQRVWLFSILSGFLLFSVLAYLFYNRYRSKQKQLLQEAIINEQKIGLKAVIEAQEAERKRIAKDLHDGIAQELVSLQLGLQQVQNKLEKSDIPEANQLAHLNNQLSQSATEVRNISHVMMPPTLETQGLVPSLELLLRNTTLHTHLQTDFEHFNLPEKINNQVELGLYRIAQELLTNVIKHAAANKIILQLYKTGESLIMKMENDGTSFDFDTARKKGSMGLLNILSRVNTLGGSFNSEQGIPSGTISTIRIPI